MPTTYSIEPAKVNFNVGQGTSFRQRVLWKDLDTDTAMSLVGYTARMTVKFRQDDAAAILNLTTENGGLTLNVVPGSIDIYISAISTALLAERRAVYDLEIMYTDSNGRVIIDRLMHGSLNITLDITA